MTDLEAERVAICVEAGVPEARARQIAACERRREEARAARLLWWCDCGGHS